MRGYVVNKRVGFQFSKDENQLISENVRRILLTKRGERVNELEFGSDVRSYLFNPEARISDVINEIRNSITRCEPRVLVKSVTLTKQKDDEFTIKVEMKVLSDNSDVTTELNI